LVVVERNKLRLRGLGFEIRDDVLSEGVLSPDFEHGKELVEMALGELGIHTHLLHHDFGSGPFSIGCNFENGLVTRFLSIRAELKMGST
jgi:hypothetical protein